MVTKKSTMKKIFWIAALIGLSACNWFEVPEPAQGEETALSMAKLNVPDGFNYETTEEVTLRISAVDNQGRLMTNIPFRLFRPGTDSTELIQSGITGNEGVFEQVYPVDVNAENLILTTTYPGLPDAYWLTLDDSVIEIVMGDYSGVEPPPGMVKDEFFEKDVAGSDDIDFRNNNFLYMGSYNSQGVPNYLLSPNDVVQQSILSLIANSLPEGQPVPSYNPQYIASGTNANTELTELCDVWITFVHEGAGYKNALGYYTYQTNNPPSSVDDIDNYYIIFPNASYAGSGGGLQTGNKVYIGQYPAGTSIGWFLVPDGWDSGAQSVIHDNNNGIKYSDRVFNTFTSSAYRSHVVLLQDPANELLLLGFEDIDRPGGDNDFNDAVFYITANPFQAVKTDGLPSVQTTVDDDDDDGVDNNNDDFIDDPDIAFVNYVPAENQFSTLAFEDRWPLTGDYDLNDMVIDYNFAEFRNASNKVIKLRCTFVLQAMGAGYRNGFGFQLDLPSSAVSEVSGYVVQEDWIQLDGRGLESGQNKATIIVFDNGYRLMSSPGGGFVNTQAGSPAIDPVTITIDITLTSPRTSAQVGVAPYNPFLIINRQRGYEVHLPDMAPTAKADASLFGTGQDDSSSANGRYYKTANNLPWAIHIPSPFDWPKEKEAVNAAYLNFNNWAQSGGVTSTDWYVNQAGYRNTSKIY